MPHYAEVLQQLCARNLQVQLQGEKGQLPGTFQDVARGPRALKFLPALP